MDEKLVEEIIIWAAFTVLATVATYKISLADAKLYKKAALYLVLGVILTILFGIARGVAFFVTFPMLFAYFSKKKASILSRVALENAKNFQQHAKEMGFGIQLPFDEKPHIAAFPLSIPERPGTTLAYADFKEYRIALVTKSIRKNTQDQKESISVESTKFVRTLIGLLEKYGPVLQADGTYRWSADGSHKHVQVGVEKELSEGKSGELESIDLITSGVESTLLPEIYESVHTHMDLVCSLCEEQLQGLDGEQIRRFLAFELGVIEWHNQSMLSMKNLGGEDRENKGDASFFNFLTYYANKKYGDRGESVFQIYSDLATKGGMFEERKLGYDSIAGLGGPEHCGTNKLALAVGFAWP